MSESNGGKNESETEGWSKRTSKHDRYFVYVLTSSPYLNDNCIAFMVFTIWALIAAGLSWLSSPQSSRRIKNGIMSDFSA